MKIGYARVSTTGQSLDAQVAELQAQGVKLDNIFQEKITGARKEDKKTKEKKTIKDRREFQNLMRHVRAGDEVIITKIDRLARSIKDLNDVVEKLTEKGVSVRFIQDDLYFSADDNTPMNTLIFNMLGAFAQFERDLIVQRTSEGRERAKKQGKHMGRHGRPKQDIKRALDLYDKREENGMSIKDIVELTKVPKSTIYYELKNRRDADE